MIFLRRLIPLFALLTLFSCVDMATKNEEDQKVEQQVFVNTRGLYKIPDSIFFCNEWVYFDDYDMRERLDRELLNNAFSESSTLMYTKRANRFFPEMERVLKANGLPDDMKYLAVAESGLNMVTSPAGARGVWQFMPATAKEYNLEINRFVDERLSLEKSTLAACQYLKNSNDTFNNWILTMASYNRGIGGVRSDLKWQSTSDYFDTHMNSETGRYIFRIMALKYIMENPKMFGYDIENIELYEPYEVKRVQITDGIDNVADWAISNGANYKVVKTLNPWILQNDLPKKDTFEILLPANKSQFKIRRK